MKTKYYIIFIFLITVLLLVWIFLFHKEQVSVGGIDTKGFDISIQMKFNKQTAKGEFSDTLYYKPDEWAEKTEQDILADQQKRADNWVNMITNSQSYVPTQKDLEEQKKELEERAELIKQQLNSLNEQIAK